MRLVSSLLALGGDERCEVVNTAVNVLQTDGKLGVLTERLSPVATVCAPAAAATKNRTDERVVTTLQQLLRIQPPEF
jgi:hypothetical protein